MRKQLQLVETPQAPRPPRSDAAHRRPRPARGQVARGGRRRARWQTDWRLDGDTRRVGRAGVEAARQALARAHVDPAMRKAS